jgi:hypothetical protein
MVCGLAFLTLQSLAASAGRSLLCYNMFVYKGKANFVEAYYGPTRFQEAEDPRFLDNRRT